MKTDLFETEKAAATRTVRVEFDGGTTCNIPRLGYGDGYGSYRIDGLPVVRVQFGPMSANAAEVLTLCAALASVDRPESAHVVIHGDSQIALNRAVPKPRVKKGRIVTKPFKMHGSEIFQNACSQLTDLISRFASAETRWRGRAESVRVFGH